MILSSTLLSFAALSFMMSLSPGPNLFYLISRAICDGRKAALVSLLGVCCGMFVYMLAAAMGLLALFTAVPVAYDVVRLIGVAYLLWLAYKAFTNQTPIFTATELATESHFSLFRKGLFTCLLNPKIVITYGALLPQFIDPSTGQVLQQTITLGVVQIVSAGMAHTIVIFAAASLASVFRSSQTFAKLQSRLLGCVLSYLAVRLAFDKSLAN